MIHVGDRVASVLYPSETGRDGRPQYKFLKTEMNLNKYNFTADLTLFVKRIFRGANHFDTYIFLKKMYYSIKRKY